jgi:hypothetical protein
MTAEPQTIPPKIAVGPSPVIFASTVVLVLAALGSGAVLYFFNPATHGFYPVCMFHKLTGLNCPGCGATRAAYQLLHGHLFIALRDNALFLLALAVLGARWLWWAVRRVRRQPATLALPPKALWWFLVLTLVFGVLRNLPAFSFLSP